MNRILSTNSVKTGAAAARGGAAFFHRGISPVSARGFSLVEVLLSIVLVGLGVTSVMALSGSCSKSMGGAARLSDAVFLTQEIREMTLALPFVDPQDPNAAPGVDAGDSGIDDLDDMLGRTFSPAIDAAGAEIGGLPGWSQTVSLTWVDPVSLADQADGSTGMVRVSVAVDFQGQTVLTTSWLAGQEVDS